MMSEPQRLHPAGIVIIGVRIARELVVPALAPLGIQLFRTGFDFADPRLLFFGGLALFIFLGGSAGYAFLAWSRYTYRVEAGELRIEQGVITRKRRYIPLERIQAVDLVEGVLQRAMGVVSARVQTASGGGGQPEASLAAISRESANQLQQELARRRVEVGESVEETGPAPLRRLTFGQLLVAGSTAGRVGVALSVVASVYAFISNVVPWDFWPGIEDWAVGAFAFVMLGGALVGAAWLLGLIGTILAHFNFTLIRDENNLLIERGLLERRRATLPLGRIQAVRLLEPWLRQVFGLAELRVESAGYGQSAAESTVLYPMLRRNDVVAFLREASPELAVDPELRRLPSRARQRYIVRAIIVSGLVASVIAALFYPWGLGLYLIVPFAALLGLWQYRDAGWGIDGDVLILRTRSLARTTAIIPRRRVQASTVSTNPFQRRAKLSTFSVSVASGPSGRTFELLHMDADDAAWLFEWSSPGGVARAAPERVLDDGAPDSATART